MRLALLLALVLVACGGGATSETFQDIDPDLPPAGTAPAGWPVGTLTVGDAELVEGSGEAGRLDLVITGDLPDPCHIPVWGIEEADQALTVNLRSAADPDQVCAQVLQPFEIKIPLETDMPDTMLVILRSPSAEYQFDVDLSSPSRAEHRAPSTETVNWRP